MPAANGTSNSAPPCRTLSSTPPPPSYASMTSPRAFPSASKRCASFVHGSTLASPRTPCGLRMIPSAIIGRGGQSAERGWLPGRRHEPSSDGHAAARTPRAPCDLVKNIEDVAPPLLVSGGVEQRAHGACGAALAADHLAEVVGGDHELDHRGLVA